MTSKDAQGHNTDEGNKLEDMTSQFVHRVDDDPNVMEELLSDSENPLYEGWEGGCPICEDGWKGKWFSASRKTVYYDHRPFLPLDHKYRRMKKAFNGEHNFESRPKVFTSQEVFEKGYVKNAYRPEACIAERMLYELAMEYCLESLGDMRTVGISTSRHSDTLEGKGTIGRRELDLSPEKWHMAHTYILFNEDEIAPLMSKKRKQASANEASKTGEAEESAECENRRGRTVAAVFGKAILSGVKIPLEWNHNKVPIGENRDIFSSYIVVVREKVNINYRDWEEVPKEVIDDLFKFIMRGFIVPEERRNYVLGRASIRWRAFKARLRKDWMYDTKGVNPNVIIKKPPSIYPLITQADWTKFIETYTDDAFKAAELQKQGVQVRDVPRHLVWIRAHSKQKDGAMTFDNPADFEIAQTIVKSIGGSTIQGEIEATGRNDILARALKNPEHGGCVRGVGSGVTNKLYFCYNKPLPQSQLQSDLKCLKSKLENVVNTQNLLLSYLMSSGQVNVEQLIELGDSNGNQVAHQLAGIQAGGSGGQGLDGLGLGRDSWLQELDDHLDVFGSKGDQGFRGFNFQDQNFQACEVQPEPYHVAWPEEEYVLENENLETHVLNNEQDITGQPFPKADKQVTKEIAAPSPHSPSSQSSCTRKYTITHADKLKLTSNLVRVFKDVAIAMKTSGKTKSFTVLARVFQNEQCVTLDFEDMLDCGHWMLAIICPWVGLVHWLDPAGVKDEPPKFAQTIINKAMNNFSTEHRKDITKIKKKPYIKWISIECPRQANGSSDSGYYVCRYMIETIESRQMIIPDKNHVPGENHNPGEKTLHSLPVLHHQLDPGGHHNAEKLLFHCNHHW
uniref:Uncharacterized protein n=1 Tax=Chenopodium quinoa TaxID=63459 RepID=A0A803KV15_CHEQI